MVTATLTMQGVVGKSNDGVADASSVIAEMPGLVTVSEVVGSVVGSSVVGSVAVVVAATAGMSDGAVVSMVMVVSVGVG